MLRTASVQSRKQHLFHQSNIHVNMIIDDTHQRTALHDRSLQPEQVEALIQKGADVNAQDCHGSTPLHRFCYRPNKQFTPNDLKIIKLLVQHGASPEIRNDHGRKSMSQEVMALITVDAGALQKSQEKSFKR